MSHMLRHKPTGVLYIATPQLLRRPDMEVIEDTPDEKPKPKAKAKRATKADKPAVEVEEPEVLDAETQTEDENSATLEQEEVSDKGPTDDLFGNG